MVGVAQETDSLDDPSSIDVIEMLAVCGYLIKQQTFYFQKQLV